MARQQGFSLLELLAGIGILGILVLTAIPQLAELTASYRMREVTEKVKADISNARHLALRNASYVVLTISGTGTSYSFGVDRLPLNSPATPDSVSYANTLDSKYQLSSTASEIIFTPRGYVVDDTGRNQSFALVLTGPGSRTRSLTVLPTGFTEE